MISTPLRLRTEEHYEAHKQSIYRFTDRLFCILMMVQYLGAIIGAILTSPKTWEGNDSAIHPHVWIALLLGAVIALPVCLLTAIYPGRQFTRYAVAVNQMLMGALLIHVSGGRIETHFHVFGSLAFLAFYRDWKIMIPATLTVLADHIFRGVYFPASIYGVTSGAQWRFIEHATWVVFEDVILFASIFKSQQEMHAMAERQAEIEFANEHIEGLVVERTAELRSSEMRKSAVLYNAMDGIVTLDENGKITEMNPAGEVIFGVAQSSVLGRPFGATLIAEQSQELHRQKVSILTREDSVFNAAGRWRCLGQREDGPFEIEISICPVQLESGRIYTAFVRDLSDTCKLEAQLLQAQKMESIGQMATGIAHEINTPNQYIGDNVRFLQDSVHQVLAAIDGYRTIVHQLAEDSSELKQQAEQIETQADLAFIAEEMPEAVAQALEGVERVGNIVRAMKEFSHPGVGGWTEVNLNQIVQSTLTVSRNEWKYAADAELELDPNLPAFSGNSGEIGQAVLNLVVNAAQAIKEKFDNGDKGQIRITTSSDADHVMLTISDNGSGIPENLKMKIFDPFFTTKGVGIGSGQGLPITLNVVQHHQGKISVESTAGEGTQFTLQFPLALADEKDAQEEIAA